MRHLAIAQELFDKVGEGRACWSLGNAHSAMGQHKEAYHYAMRHLEISRDTGDTMGQTTAQVRIIFILWGSMGKYSLFYFNVHHY